MIAVGGLLLISYLTAASDAYAIKRIIIAAFLIGGGAAIIYADLTDSD